MSDALQKSYSVSRIANRWPLTIFFFMLNMIGVNGAVIEKENKQTKIIRKEFLFALGKAIVAESCKRRLYETNIP